MNFVHNERIVEIQNYSQSFHKLRAQFWSAWIKSAFDPSFGWYFKESSVCASHLTRRDDFISARNNVKAFIADQGSFPMSVLVSDGTEFEANAER